MKKLLLFITLISFAITQAQIVNIPDANFKNALLSGSNSNHITQNTSGLWVNIDTNNDGEIQVNEALDIKKINVSRTYYNDFQISDITGIQEFINLEDLKCVHNLLTFINVYENNSLVLLDCAYNNISNIDTNEMLETLYIYNNNLSQINLSSNTHLKKLNVDSNQLTNLNVTNNDELRYLSCEHNDISSLILIYNLQLRNLFCTDTTITDLDISNNTELYQVWSNGTDLNEIDLTNNTNLHELWIRGNNLTELDVSNNPNLEDLRCSYNDLTAIDISNNPLLNTLECKNNINLTNLNLKNGNNENFYLNSSKFNDLPNLQNVCVDELNTDLTAFIVTQTGHAVTFTEYCSFEPAQSNTINGTVNIDINNNGCDTNDASLNNVLITTDNGTESFGTFVLTDASYAMFTNEGDFTTAITTNLPDFWSATPTEYTNNFTGFNNTFTADFCITPNQTVNDVNITLIPTSQARPGFDTRYRIIYKNVGTTQLNGSINLDFDDTMLSFLNASETVATQTANNLTFNYTNLNPFETRTIDLEFNVNAPTAAQPVNIGDILNFSATINPIAGDYTTDDNIFTLDQIVVGSYDPNDITCLEGDDVWLGDTDKYLHYVIRFQNKGTASAINVVVANNLDANLDWSTLQLESSSHTNRVAIKNGNEIEFIFENINLPDENTDEPGSHGFIAYKIKPKADIALGDIIPNQADIFFDYNEAIPTNTVTTTIVDVSAVNNNTLLDFYVYPTPTENILNINSKTAIVKISIFSKLGQLIKETTENKVDISNLTQGLYFVKVEGINGNSGVKKIVKK